MATENKICPKCPESQVMQQFEGAEIALPAIEGNANASKISTTACLPVEVYRCPRCNFVELYAT